MNKAKRDQTLSNGANGKMELNGTKLSQTNQNFAKPDQTRPNTPNWAKRGKTILGMMTVLGMVTILGIVTSLEKVTVLLIVTTLHPKNGGHPRDFYYPNEWVLS